ncbi:MAG TPA: ATP-binding protein, partial [Thermoanaerobaculia bacterium]
PSEVDLSAPPAFRTLFESSPDLYLVLEPDLRIAAVNDAYLSATMTRREDIIGKYLFEVFPDNPDDPAATGVRNLSASLHSVLRTGEPDKMAVQKYDIRRPESEGGAFEERYWSPINWPVFDNGKLTHIIHRVEDVTEYVRMQDLQASTERRARQGEEMFRLLVESVVDYAIYMLDAEGRIVTWNTGAQRIKQYRTDEVLGKNYSIFYPEEEVRAGKPKRDLDTSIRDGRFEEEGWRVRKDGGRFWANCVITPVFDDTGTLRGFAKVTRDITAMRELEEQREARQRAEAIARAAEQANREKDDFIAVVSHELRTPMTSILGWARMLALGDLDDDTYRGALDAIQRSAKTQAQIIEDLLDESRIASGRLHLERRAVDFATVIDNAVRMAQPQANGKDIDIVVNPGDASCQLYGDPLRLQQVVGNVLANAVKFTPEGGRIFVTLRREGTMGALEIRDTGRGIDPALLPHVFDRFRKGDSSTDRIGGLGLGLAIARHLVELHGGSIDAGSGGEKKGATFTIRLPLHEVPMSSTRFVDRDAERRGGVLPLLGDLRVLVIEDEIDNRKVIAATLEKSGAEVRCVGTAETAFNEIEAWRPHVLVCDIGLPDLDGCTFLERLRKRKADAPPALALTVLGRPNEQARIRAAGFGGFRQKPIDPIDLAYEVARLAAQVSR